jgi:GTP cyclohydrolase I
MKRPQPKQHEVCVADLISWMEGIAPPELAEEWDNSGLQVGSVRQPVKKVWVALDPLEPVIEAAVARKIDLLITHHPLILRPLSRVDFATPVGRAIATAIKGNLSIYSAHTNLDSAAEGINDILARRIGLTETECLMPAPGGAHTLGLGRIGRLDPPFSVGELARRIKAELHLDIVKAAGDMAQIATRAAICSGGGSSLVEAFLESNAHVYISGDMRYHNARDVEAAGRALIDIGHFPSEHIVVEDLVFRLRAAADGGGWALQVEACRLEHDPFVAV